MTKEDDDLRLGRQALERGLIDREGLEEALRERDRRPSVHLGDIFRSLDLIDTSELHLLEEEVRRLSARAPAPPPAEVVAAMADPAKRFGKYVLLNPIGEGGMGVVFKAWDPTMSRYIALKRLRRMEEPFIRRFHREAQTAGRLAHPHIVPVHEVGDHEGQPFIAMEFVDGAALGSLRLEPRRAAEILRDVARAIHAAHEAGIIHRDIKPQNLLLDRAGQVWVTDFGAARPLAHGETVTSAGVVIGTPVYMAPEQAGAERCDVRTDVYGLGATLYDLLAGRPPFTGQSMLEVLDKVRRDDPEPLRRIDARIERDLQTIVQKAMDRKPESRYATARDLADDLDRHLPGEPILARPHGVAARAARQVRRHPTAAALAVVALLAAGYFVVQRLRLHALERRAMTASDPEEAARLWDQLAALGDEAAGPRADEARRRAQIATDRRRSRETIAEAASRAKELSALLESLARLRGQARDEEERINPWDPPDAKAALWSLQQQIAAAERQSIVLEAQTIRLFTTARQLDRSDRIGVAQLAEFLKERIEAVERFGETERAAFLEESLRQLARDAGLESMLAWLEGGGTLALDSDPPGAEVSLVRHVEGPDRRLGLEANERRLGACPLAPVALARGSYRLVVRKEGYADTRFLAWIDRGTRQEARVRLHRAEEIGRGFVHVPAGPFIMAGDREAYQGRAERTVVEVRDFFIARSEVTMSEYVEYLDALLQENQKDEAQRRLPRTAPTGPAYASIRDGRVVLHATVDSRWPAFGLSWDDAVAYAQWLTAKAAKRGERGLYRLPTAAEWEKAARGVDGRLFPWGNAFDWTFTNGGRAAEHSRLLPGASVAADESPYGVLDMAGGVREWVADWFAERYTMKEARGGAWNDTNIASFHCAARTGTTTRNVANHCGLRLVRQWP